MLSSHVCGIDLAFSTPEYMAPEIIMNQVCADGDTRSLARYGILVEEKQKTEEVAVLCEWRHLHAWPCVIGKQQ